MSAVHPGPGWRAGHRGRHRRTLLALAFALVTTLAWPAGAIAHVRTGTIAVDYRAAVAAPASGAYRAEIDQGDHTLRLTVGSGHVVTVLGYLQEPMIRVDHSGVWVSRTSPSAVAVGLLPRGDATTGSGPRWRRLSAGRSVGWRDARAQQLPAGVDESSWAVALVVDGRPAVLRGVLRRYPAPPLLGWGLMLAGLLAGGIWLPMARRLELTRAGALGCAGLAAGVCLILALGFALDDDASPGIWIEGFNEIVFAAVGLAVLVRGHGGWRAVGAIGLGLVGLAVALLDSPVFLHPVVLSLLPGGLTRLLVVVAAGAGLVAIGLGGVGYADLIPGLEV